MSNISELMKKLLPNKEDAKSEKIRKSVFLISVLVLILSLILLLIALLKPAPKAIEPVETEATTDFVLDGTLAEPIETTVTTEEPKRPKLAKYEEWYAKNNDTIGWIKVPNTPIDDPVVQSTELSENGDNYYINHTFEGKKSASGATFVDWRESPFDNGRRPDNTILYGHNLYTGDGFAKVTNYYPAKYGSISFAVNNPIIQFDTLYDEGTYKVFAVIYANTLKEHGEPFEYYKTKKFTSKKCFYDYIGNIMDRSTIFTDVDIEYGDELLTLSTCYYPLGKAVDSRVAVFARRVRPGEDPTVDTTKTVINKDPLYFDFYYQCMGGSWGGRNWDTSKVKGFDEFYK